MQVGDIIAELYKSKDINKIIAKMEPVELQDDLRQEIFLILLEKGEQKILDLYRNGGLKFYTIRIILSTIKSKTSKFYYTYRKHRHVQFV